MLRRVLLVVGVLVLGSTMTMAGPIYVGASAARTNLQASDQGGSFDTNASGYKLYAGWRFMKFFGLEASYVHFGSPSDSDAGIELSVDATAYDLFAVGVLPLGKHLELFAKAGYFRWERTTDTSGAVNGSESDNGSDPVYGVGGAFKFGKHLAVRVEYEEYKMSDVDKLTQGSAGVDFRF